MQPETFVFFFPDFMVFVETEMNSHFKNQLKRKTLAAVLVKYCIHAKTPVKKGKKKDIFGTN